jgi:hypothetical protein
MFAERSLRMQCTRRPIAYDVAAIRLFRPWRGQRLIVRAQKEDGSSKNAPKKGGSEGSRYGKMVRPGCCWLLLLLLVLAGRVHS